MTGGMVISTSTLAYQNVLESYTNVGDYAAHFGICQ